MIAVEGEGRTALALAGLAGLACGVVAASASASVAPAYEPPPVQAAVLGDGFVAAEPTATGWRVVDVDDRGTPRAAHALATDGADARIVGSPAGPLAGVLWGNHVHLVRARDGRDVGTWGSDARRLCDGAASNAERFGVAWLEGNGGVWVVHGPTASAVDGDRPVATAARWCSVSSAGRNIVLMWRDGKRMYFNTCTQKSCRPNPPSIKLAERDELLGAGCIASACLIATRAPGAAAELRLITAAGGTKWRSPLDTKASTVAIVGVGDDAFAVGFVDAAGGTVLGIDLQRATKPLWRGDGAPAVAWARGRVAVAARRDHDDDNHALAITTVAYP